jgi:hypothetical protein
MLLKNIISAQIERLLCLSRSIALVIPVAVITGLIVAFFLWLLDFAIALRWNSPWLIYLLPLLKLLTSTSFSFLLGFGFLD